MTDEPVNVTMTITVPQWAADMLRDADWRLWPAWKRGDFRRLLARVPDELFPVEGEHSILQDARDASHQVFTWAPGIRDNTPGARFGTNSEE